MKPESLVVGAGVTACFALATALAMISAGESCAAAVEDVGAVAVVTPGAALHGWTMSHGINVSAYGYFVNAG